MTIEEFINQLDAGQITDFSPFLEKTYSEHFRAEMVKRGIHVYEALAYNEQLPILAAIRANLMEEHYEQWSTHNAWKVRKELAKKGYFPEVFSRDNDSDVRSAVFFAYPHLAKDALSNYPTYAKMWENIKFEREIPAELLEIFLHTPIPQGRDDIYLPYVQRKYEGMKATPTPFEATMSFKQLFSTDNPLWAKDLTVDEQMRLVRRIKMYGQEYVEEHLEEYITIPQ